jgi:hypothetical protein
MTCCPQGSVRNLRVLRGLRARIDSQSLSRDPAIEIKQDTNCLPGASDLCEIWKKKCSHGGHGGNGGVERILEVG